MESSHRSTQVSTVAARRLGLDRKSSGKAYYVDRQSAAGHVNHLQPSPSTATADAGAIRQIDLDMPRTAGGDPVLSARLSWARAMLVRQLAEDPELGYCQGMNLGAAIFAAAASSYTEAYSRFHDFVGRVRGLWMPGFPELQRAVVILDAIAPGRRWKNHLDQLGIEPMMYLPQALLTVFTSWLPPPTLLQCLPLLERGGLASMLAMTLAVLKLVEPELLRQTSADAVMPMLRSMAEIAPDPRALSVAMHRELPTVNSTLAREDLHAGEVDLGLQRELSKVLTPRGDEVFPDSRKAMLSIWLAGAGDKIRRWASSEKAKAGAVLFRISFSVPFCKDGFPRDDEFEVEPM